MPRFEASPEPSTLARAAAAFITIALGLSVVVHLEPSFASPSRGHETLGMFGVTTAILLAPLFMRFRSVAMQVVGRAILLQLTAFGTLVVVHDLPTLSDEGLVGGVLMATGLVSLAIFGLRGLGASSDKFAPTAFRKTLLASLVFGLADMWALLFYGTMEGDDPLLFLCAAVMSIALYGLFRLKVWGLVACVVANVLVAALALGGALDTHEVLRFGLAATAAIQLMLPIPLVRAMLKRAPARG